MTDACSQIVQALVTILDFIYRYFLFTRDIFPPLLFSIVNQVYPVTKEILISIFTQSSLCGVVGVVQYNVCSLDTTGFDTKMLM